MNANAIKDVMIITAAIWGLTAFAPPRFVLIGASGIGLVVLVLGVIKIYRNTHNCLSGGADKKSLIIKLVLAIVVASISLLFWSQIFVLKDWNIFTVNADKIIALWAINTGIYVYLQLCNPSKNLLRDAQSCQESSEDKF